MVRSYDQLYAPKTTYFKAGGRQEVSGRLFFPFIFGNFSALENAAQSAYWQSSSTMLGHNHLQARLRIPPFTMTALLRDELKAVLREQAFDLARSSGASVPPSDDDLLQHGS